MHYVLPVYLLKIDIIFIELRMVFDKGSIFVQKYNLQQ